MTIEIMRTKCFCVGWLCLDRWTTYNASTVGLRIRPWLYKGSSATKNLYKHLPPLIFRTKPCWLSSLTTVTWSKVRDSLTKLEDKHHDPFQIQAKVGSAAYRLKLLRQWKAIHPVSNEALLWPSHTPRKHERRMLYRNRGRF